MLKCIKKWWYQTNQAIFLARLGFLRKGLNNSGTNQYPMKMKLTPRFLVLLKKPVVLKLITLYKSADENAIKIDLTLMSPTHSKFSSLNLVISVESVLSISWSESILFFKVWW